MLGIAAIVAVALLAVASILLVIERRAKPVDTLAARDHLDTIAGWPPQAVRVMTLDERQAFEIARRAMPRHLVLAQVPLARFISVPTQNAYATWLSRAGRISVDILITDGSSRPVAAIEIHGADESPRSLKRHERLTQVLQAAGIPVHAWREDALPTLEEATRQLCGKQTDEAAESTETAVSIDEQGRRVLPVAQVEELLAAGDQRDYGHDQHDPVASTFFDDLDALPAKS